MSFKVTKGIVSRAGRSLHSWQTEEEGEDLEDEMLVLSVMCIRDWLKRHPEYRPGHGLMSRSAHLMNEVNEQVLLRELGY